MQNIPTGAPGLGGSGVVRPPSLPPGLYGLPPTGHFPPPPFLTHPALGHFPGSMHTLTLAERLAGEKGERREGGAERREGMGWRWTGVWD
jgi:hypothetical protein